MTKRLALGLLPFAGLAYCFLGCSEQSNRLPAPSVVGATAAGLSTNTPMGPFPRGAVNPANLPARQGPLVQVLTPPRGAQLTTTSVTVEVSAVDPDGVQTVTIAGAPAASLGGDRYGASVALAPGMNLVEVVATDALGDRSSGRVALMQGQFEAAGAFVGDSVRVRLDTDALDLVARKVEAAAAPLDLLTLIHQGAGRPILNTSIITVDVTAVTHAPLLVPRFALTAGGVSLAVELNQLGVELDVSLLGRGLVHVTTDRVRVDAHATFGRPLGAATGIRLLGADVDQLDLTFDNLRIQTRSGLANAVITPFRGLIERAVENAVEKALRKEIADLLQKPMVMADKPLRLNMPDFTGAPVCPLDLLLRVDAGRGWAGAGLDLVAAMSVTAPQPRYSALNAGVLVTRPAAPNAAWAATHDVSVAISTDALNAFLHGYWLTGAGRYQVDGTKPTVKKPLAARVLYPFFPILRDLAPDPDTPIVIDASLEAPPIIRLDPSASPVAVAVLVPEAQVSILVDYMDGGPRLEVLRARLSLEARGKVDVVNMAVTFTDLDCSTVGMDVIAEPAGDLDDQGVEDFIVQALPTLVPGLSSLIPSLPIPALPLNVQLVNYVVEVEAGHLIVRTDVR
jgi:hypothetical protein